MSEYDLKKSKKIGQLYPVLVDSKGNVIDGFHRLEADPKWRTEKLAEIDTEEKLLVARCVANWHRRQVSVEEKKEWINGLARIYKKQGLKVKADFPFENQIKNKIVEVTGLHHKTVENYLSNEFKQRQRRPEETQQPRLLASERIEHELGREYVERHREEVEQELRSKIEREAREKIVEEEIKPKIKEELSRDAGFIREAIEKAPEVLPTLSEEIIERAKRAIEPSLKEMMGKIELVKEIDTGDIWLCPSCKKKFHLIHVEPRGTHRFEEVVE
jgi:hypothetical protein